MRTLARSSVRHRWLVLGAWLAALVVVGVALLTVGAGYDDEFSLPDTESSRALELLQRVSPTASGDSLTTVAAVPTGRITDPAPRERFTAALAELEERPEVAAVASPYAPGGERQISADGRTAFATVTLAGLVPNDVTNAQVEELLEDFTAREGDGVQLEITGQAATGPPEQGLGEVVGLAAAAVVLFWVFGSLIAMSLPLITAVLSLAVSLSAVGLLANLFTVATFAPTLSALLGLGVGIDYALFIVTRYRAALLEGATPEEATVTAVDTSGRAVLFAGITVCIALLGLFALGLSFLYGVAVAASLSVATTVLASLTLLPALLGLFGVRVLPRREQAQLGRGETGTPGAAGWTRWARVLDRRPKLLAVVSLVVMLAIAAPFTALRLGLTDQGSDPEGSTTRQGYDLLAAGFGPGFNGPLVLVTDLGASPDPAATQRLAASVAADVAAVTPTAWLGGPVPGTPAPGGVGVTTVYPRSAPQDAETDALVQRLREDLVPQAVQGSGQQVLVGGATAIFQDFSRVIADKLPLFVGVVVLLSFLLLTAVFRSLVVAATAALMNLLSAAAAFGVVVAVFQLGYGNELFGIERTGPILAFLPVILFAILFGLSMDYEVFLLSRIHEEWLHTGDNRAAVMHGLAVTGRTITAAAAIMVMLFLAFVLGPDLTIKLFGLGLAAAVLLDALVVRSVLVPALMLVLGRANWYLPRALDRVLPRLSVEGPAAVPAAATPEPVRQP